MDAQYLLMVISVMSTEIRLKNRHDLCRIRPMRAILDNMVYNVIDGVRVQTHFDSKVEAVLLFSFSDFTIDHDNNCQTMEQGVQLVLILWQLQRWLTAIKLFEFLTVDSQSVSNDLNVSSLDGRKVLIRVREVVKCFEVRDLFFVRFH
jgi:hypothetical protein